MEQQANAACVEHERLPLRTRSARDLAGLGARFLDDRLGVGTTLVRDVLGRLLGGDERLAKQVLEILVPYSSPSSCSMRSARSARSRHTTS